MDLLRALNRTHGLTLVVVTHEPDIAALTDRVVMMRDRPRGGGRAAGPRPRTRGGAGGMKLVRMNAPPPRGGRSGRNLTRSLLTMLWGGDRRRRGDRDGEASGRAPMRRCRPRSRALGTNIVMVIPGATTAGGVRSGWGGASTLTVGDAKAIEKECPSVAAVTYVKREIAQVTYGHENWATAIQGSPPSYSAVRDWPVARGRFFTQSEEDSAAKVAVLGQTLVDKLFVPGEDPLGAAIRVRAVPFRVVGVLAPKGQTTWGQDQDDVVIVPFSTAERRVLGTAFLGTVNMIPRLVPDPPPTPSRRRGTSRASCACATAPRPARRTTSRCAACASCSPPR